MIVVGQTIKVFLRNNMAIEGIVENTSPQQLVLRSLNDGNIIIIHHPNEDIIVTKILPDINITEKKEFSENKENVIKNKLEKTLKIEDPELRNLNIKELRQLVIEQDKNIIAEKTKEHFGGAGNGRTTKYNDQASILNKSAYKPKKLPNWVYGRPPERK